MQPGVYLGRTLLPPKHQDLCVSIVNTTAEPRTVAAGEWLGNLHDVEMPSGQEQSKKSPDQQQSGAVPTSTETVDVRAAAASATSSEIVDSLLQQLPDSSVSCYTELSGYFLDRRLDDMGRTNLVEHEINTGNHSLIRQGLRGRSTS